MAKLIMTVKGANGTIDLMVDRLVIHRKGIANLFKYGWHARREIPLASIASINFRDASFFKTGEIDFDHAGRNQFDRRSSSVAFTRKNQQQFMDLKDKIFELMQTKR